MRLVEPLEIEDFVVQPTADVSPPKWHLAHTTWFFETFILQSKLRGYKLFDQSFPLLFNSYYVAAGDRWSSADRGSLTRPTVRRILDYRLYVEGHVVRWLEDHKLSKEAEYVVEVGLQHEQQHQELLLYDIKFILGHNPLFPAYSQNSVSQKSHGSDELNWLSVAKGNYHIGYDGEGFCFDNELGHHEVHLEAFEISNRLITNGEYLAFMEAGGYSNHAYWLSDGWDWINDHEIKSPMYWLREHDVWYHYSLAGLEPLPLAEPVAHISYYEADAFAKWKGMRLPTEFEWEVAASKFGSDEIKDGNFVESKAYSPVQSNSSDFLGNLWEWTSSAYLPYPFYKIPEGALGEYNGKFMVNQQVLRGGSFATPKEHIRTTYRNFFHPKMQWLASGIRLAKYTEH